MRTIITGAKIWKHGNSGNRLGASLIIENGRISEVVNNRKLTKAHLEDAKVIRLKGGVIIPAFFDAHVHLDQGGKYLTCIQLDELVSSDDVLEVIKNFLENKKPGDEWVTAIGLHELAWPSIRDINSISQGIPLVIYTRDYHSAIINEKAMELVGLERDTRFPTGGWQDFLDNMSTGILRENAIMWLEEKMPPETVEDKLNYISKAVSHLESLGVLGVSDASRPEFWEVYKQLMYDKKLKIKIESWLRFHKLDSTAIPMQREYYENLRRNRIKLFLDGALGSYSAWMKDEYCDKAGIKGEPVPDLEQLFIFLTDAVELGWAIALHAIGDAAVEFAVEVLSELPEMFNKHRIEHLQHITPDIIEKLAKTAIVPSVQPLHRISDKMMLLDRVGEERANLSFPAKSLHNDCSTLILGTDWPIVSVNPFKTMAAAIGKREEFEGMPGEELSEAAALISYTKHSANIGGFKDTGALNKDMRADMIWLKDDPRGDGDKWSEARPSAIWNKGELVVQNEDF